MAVTVPTPVPVSTPPAVMVAVPLPAVMVQVPPVTELASVIAEPLHTDVAPVIAAGGAPTVIAAVAAHAAVEPVVT